MKPFVKWAGEKSRILPYIIERLPKFDRYAEVFVGGGALLYHVLEHQRPKNVYLSDINPKLIDTYTTIRDRSETLFRYLKEYQLLYQDRSEVYRDGLYYGWRNDFNSPETKTRMSALFIALNKTCSNGLYRVNGNGEFDVPKGIYDNPLIFDAENLTEIHNALQGVKIKCADYTKSILFLKQGIEKGEETFVYFDPPYRPLTQTASFTSYTKTEFNDEEQKRLARYIKRLNSIGVKFLLSNSDPHNTNPDDDFFDRLYDGFTIERIPASRMINSDGSKCGKITEILVRNY